MSLGFRILLFGLLAVLGLITTTALQAKPDKPAVSGSVQGQATVPIGDSGLLSVSAGISFGEARELAVQYGMTGTKPLPKGIRKNMARGKPMPPGIAKTRLPGTFVNELPVHEGYEWRQAGPDLLLVVSGSLVISDILAGVFD